MTLGVGLYVRGSSWLYRLDPRVKLYFSLLGVVTGLVLGHPLPLLGLATFINVILLAGGVPLGRVARLWRQLAPLMLMIVAFQSILTPDIAPPLGALGPVSLTASGLLLGSVFALRIAAGVFATGLLLFTTSPDSLVRGLVGIGLPYPIGLTIWLALRYLGTLGQLYTSIAEAQQARGWVVTQRNLWKRARAVVPTLVALTIASLRLSDNLALGLAARGMGAPYPRTSLRPLRLTASDWLALGLVTFIFGAILTIWLGLR
jgi:energy-coupling factor transport system permease protein